MGDLVEAGRQGYKRLRVQAMAENDADWGFHDERLRVDEPFDQRREMMAIEYENNARAAAAAPAGNPRRKRRKSYSSHKSIMSGTYYRDFKPSRNGYAKIVYKKKKATKRRKTSRSGGKYGYVRVLRGSEENRERFGDSYKLATGDQLARRRETGFRGKGLYSGRGNYWSRVKHRAAHFGRELGHELSRVVKPIITSGLTEVATVYGGAGAGALTASLLSGKGLYSGRGEYAANSLVVGDDMDTMPAMSASGGDELGTVQFSHREWLGDVFAPPAGTAFLNQSYPLNPGLESVFPWLSQIAMNYEEYEFDQLLFTYKSTTAENASSTTGQLGSVIMATNYNASKAPFADKQSMIEYVGARSTKITANMVHGVECDPAKNALGGPLFVRNNPVVSGEDLKTYDKGTFQMALSNLPDAYANEIIGEMWVEYTVTLRKPKLFTNRGLGITKDVWITPSVASGFMVNQTTMMGNSSLNWLKGQQNNLGVQLTAGTTGVTITLPDYYNGCLKVTSRLSPLAAGATVTTSSGTGIAPTPDTASGNVVAIYDMLGEGSTIVAQVASAALAVGDDFNVLIKESHWFVQSSTGGTDNVIVVPGWNSWPSGAGNNACQCTLIIEEYNNYGMTKTTDRLVYVTANGATTVDP